MESPSLPGGEDELWELEDDEVDSDPDDENTEIDQEPIPPIENDEAHIPPTQPPPTEFWEESQVDELNPVAYPLSPSPPPLEDSSDVMDKKLEMEDPSSKCVLIEDSPAKPPCDISAEIIRLQKKLADAKRESMARNFGYKHVYF